MNGQDYLRLAESLVVGSTEAEWRSAVSRAYYAAFHIARGLLISCGFNVPSKETAHAYLWQRLLNAGHPPTITAGGDLQTLRRDRNRADYEFDRPLAQRTATTQVNDAKKLIRVLEAAAYEPTKTQITDAVKIYERDVLKTVTWKP